MRLLSYSMVAGGGIELPILGLWIPKSCPHHQYPKQETNNLKKCEDEATLSPSPVETRLSLIFDYHACRFIFTDPRITSAEFWQVFQRSCTDNYYFH